MPVVLSSINKKSFHWSACLYASRLFLGTISLHLDLLLLAKTPDSQVGGTTASLEICVILVQLLNAAIPIVLTLFPILTFCRLVQPLKALLPIVVTLLGMVTEVRWLQSLKAYSLIVVTLLGMVTEVRELQPLKALSPIVVTLLGMVTEVRELQYLYLQPIITQYFIDNKSEIWLLFLIAHSKR